MSDAGVPTSPGRDEKRNDAVAQLVHDLRAFAELVDLGSGRLVLVSGEIFTDAADEIERLRALITAWADADAADGFHDEPECDCGAPLCVASAALRKAVGR